MTEPLQAIEPVSIAPRGSPPALLEKVPLERYVAPLEPSLVGMSRAQLAHALGAVGVPAAQRNMRVRQVWHWLYVRGATRFDEMTSVSKELRATLAGHFTLDRPEVVAEQISADGTRKWLLRLPGEHAGERPHEVECVYIPEADRGTLCVSSQVGCTLTCSFCHTGTQRLVRNLTSGEIVGQIMVARDRLGDWSRKSPGSGLQAAIPDAAIEPGDEPGGAARKGPSRFQHRDDGNGRAAVQFRGRARRAARGGGRRRHRHFQAPHHALDLGGGAQHRTHGGRDRLHAGGILACRARWLARPARAAQPKVSDPGAARGLPQLSRCFQRAPHHLRIRHAQRASTIRSPTPRRW